jgi:hypothetical protein
MKLYRVLFNWRSGKVGLVEVEVVRETAQFYFVRASEATGWSTRVPKEPCQSSYTGDASHPSLSPEEAWEYAERAGVKEVAVRTNDLQEAIEKLAQMRKARSA